MRMRISSIMKLEQVLDTKMPANTKDCFLISTLLLLSNINANAFHVRIICAKFALNTWHMSHHCVLMWRQVHVGSCLSWSTALLLRFSVVKFEREFFELQTSSCYATSWFIVKCCTESENCKMMRELEMS